MYKRFKWNLGIRADWQETGKIPNKPSRVFVGSTMELFGDWIKPEWMKEILSMPVRYPQHTFIFLTKRPENLIKYSPYPDNVWIGVSVTKRKELYPAVWGLTGEVKCGKRLLSFEPLLENILDQVLPVEWDDSIDWAIIGAQSPQSDKTFPEWDWVSDIINACDQMGIPVFLKNNLGLPKLSCEGATPFYKKHPSGTMILRQEFPNA